MKRLYATKVWPISQVYNYIKFALDEQAPPINISLRVGLSESQLCIIRNGCTQSRPFLNAGGHMNALLT
jgi:hypothetical protein